MLAADRRAYAAVADRAEGVCEGCGQRAAIQMHHRLYRSRGGKHEIENLLHLCLECHGVAHTLIGEHLGWSVRSGNDPADVPVFRKSTQSWTLRGEPILAAAACELMAEFGQLRTGLRGVN